MNAYIEVSVWLLLIFLGIGLLLGYIAASIYYKPTGVGTWINVHEAESNLLYYDRLLKDEDILKEMPEKELEYIHGKRNVWADIYQMILTNNKSKLIKMSKEDKKEIIDFVETTVEKYNTETNESN